MHATSKAAMPEGLPRPTEKKGVTIFDKQEKNEALTRSIATFIRQMEPFKGGISTKAQSKEILDASKKLISDIVALPKKGPFGSQDKYEKKMASALDLALQATYNALLKPGAATDGMRVEFAKNLRKAICLNPVAFKALDTAGSLTGKSGFSKVRYVAGEKDRAAEKLAAAEIIQKAQAQVTEEKAEKAKAAKEMAELQRRLDALRG